MRSNLLTVLVAGALLAGCAYAPKPAPMTKLPIYPSRTESQSMLNALPPPSQPIAVAVYGFSDQTGQFKPSNLGQTLSRAISQGGGAMLVRSLQEAGNGHSDPSAGRWFTIVEREQLRDLLNERQIIRDMRAQYLGEHNVNPNALPALLFAGVLLEGGVVGYDTNTVTGGLGATMLGIGADAKYQQDTVTVYLRAVSVKTGEVLTSVTASKTITSYAVDTNVFRYVASDKLLETENGFTTNEPGMLALQQAIDKAVYGLVMEGADLKLWSFADSAVAQPFIDRYRAERDGALTAQDVVDLERRERLASAKRGRRLAPATPPAPPPSAANTHAPPAWRPPTTPAPPAPSAPQPAVSQSDLEDHIGDLLAASGNRLTPPSGGGASATASP